MGVPPVIIGPHPYLFFDDRPKRFCMVGMRYFSGKVMHCCRIVNGIKDKNIKKQPWSNVECFAFGGATVRFASLETSFHAANHTIPPPPSYEGLPHCPKDKNRSPFHGEKPLMIT